MTVDSAVSFCLPIHLYCPLFDIKIYSLDVQKVDAVYSISTNINNFIKVVVIWDKEMLTNLIS